MDGLFVRHNLFTGEVAGEGEQQHRSEQNREIQQKSPERTQAVRPNEKVVWRKLRR